MPIPETAARFVFFFSALLRNSAKQKLTVRQAGRLSRAEPADGFSFSRTQGR
jgi:hypothetical protein